MKVINHLVNAIRASANYNPEVETRPYCILWTDNDKQWESSIQRLRTEMQELLVLGDYNPLEGKGPAIWLRTAIGGYVDGYTLPYGRIPVLYLPGVSRQDLRAVEQCPEELKPLAELQYSGVIWSQVNARDWTILAYLKTKKGGLGLDVAQDEATLQAMQRSLTRILDEKIDNLKGCHLDKDYFNSIISGVDTVKDILLWMSDPDAFKSGRSNEEWEAFVEICKSKYKFHPEQDGVYAATERLGWHDEAWDVVWNRFCEAPAKYDAIPKALRKTVMPLIEKLDRFPQWNEQQETSLRKELLSLSGMAEQNVREELLRLEQEHGQRRSLVWAELGQAPLAESLKWLYEIAMKTSTAAIGAIEEIAKAQESWGWQVDYSVIMALSIVNKQEDMDAVFSAIRAIYLPWIDVNARALQKVIQDNGYPSFTRPLYKDDECVCFVDGLRFDLAKSLSEKIRDVGISVKERSYWTPVPTVTSTCKPALTFVSEKFVGDDLHNQDFTPVVKESVQAATTQRIVKLMEDAGWSVLSENQLEKQSKNGWYETGRIDDEGHKIGYRIVYNIEGYLNDARDEITRLFNAGWKTIRIVSDHGWLLMPGGLPKMPMATSLAESKWGRCAAIKPGALFDGTYYPWYWNENVHFALADGVGCYRNGIEYTHGGISLQECLMLELVLSENEKARTDVSILITDMVWKGMRCKVAAEGEFKGLKVDIRVKPAMAETSIVMGIKEFSEGGISSVVVDDDTLEGKSAFIVVLDEGNQVVYQIGTVVGGES